MNAKKKLYILAGGGTGGHVYPGVAIAEYLKTLDPNAQIIFWGRPQSVEERILEKYKDLIIFEPVIQSDPFLSKTLFQKISSIVKALYSIIVLFFRLKKFKPKFIICLGGFVSVPVGVAAWLGKFRWAILELNARSGLANRTLKRLRPFEFRTFINEEKNPLKSSSSRVHWISYPYRRSLFDTSSSLSYEELSQNRGISPTTAISPMHILITGGSSGARGINDKILEFLLKKIEFIERENIFLTWITGHKDFLRIQENLASLPMTKPRKSWEILPYSEKMASHYRAAHIIVSRAGAGSIFEALLFEKMMILVPLPGAEAHQKENALYLYRKGLAQMIEEKDLTPLGLEELLTRVKNHDAHFEIIKENLSRYRRNLRNGAEEIAHFCAKEP